jgi:hypothetical protein
MGSLASNSTTVWLRVRTVSDDAFSHGEVSFGEARPRAARDVQGIVAGTMVGYFA